MILKNKMFDIASKNVETNVLLKTMKSISVFITMRTVALWSKNLFSISQNVFESFLSQCRTHF